jgi:probable HAF family extracellular repeat protein
LLGTLGGSWSIANDMNDLGQAAGYAGTSGNFYYHAFSTSPNGGISLATGDLGTLSGLVSSYSIAYSINASGQVAGYSDTTQLDFWPGHPFRTAANSPINPLTDDLGTLGGSYGEARDINDLGVVVGFSDLAGDLVQHAFRTQPDAPINPATDDLGTMGGSDSIARAINNNGWVTGSSDIVGNTAEHAFLLAPGQTLDPQDDLGTLGGTDSRGLDINTEGWVVGMAHIAGDEKHAFLYDGVKVHDLNDLIAPGSGWVLNEARGINDTRQITGTGIFEGNSRAFLLTITTPPPDVPPDLDKDNDVDLDDYGIFQACASGPTVAVTESCLMADFDEDLDVDQSDFGLFQLCISGADVVADPSCWDDP